RVRLLARSVTTLRRKRSSCRPWPSWTNWSAGISSSSVRRSIRTRASRSHYPAKSASFAPPTFWDLLCLHTNHADRPSRSHRRHVLWLALRRAQWREQAQRQDALAAALGLQVAHARLQ